MSKEGNFASRRLVSVPWHVAERMDQLDTGEVNWSAVATEAFLKKLDAINLIGSPDKAREVVKRLRKTREYTSTDAYREGFDYGHKWACQRATVVELGLLDEFVTTKKRTAEHGWAVFLADEEAYIDVVKAILRGESEPDFVVVLKFCELNTGNPDGLKDGRLLNGFIDGALRIWHAVKDEI